MKTLFIDGLAEGDIKEINIDVKYTRFPIVGNKEGIVAEYRVFQMHTTTETFGIGTCEEVNIEKALTKLFENYNKDLMILKGNAK